MKRDVFLMAAELIEQGRKEFACHAIDTAALEPFSVERLWFRDTFQPQAVDIRDYGRMAFFSTTEPDFPDNPVERNQRVVALCFAYAMTGR